jgi:predicted transcriptional regulator
MAKSKKTSETKTETKKVESKPAVRPLSEQRVKILKFVAKGPKTRKQIGEAFGIKTGFCSLLGHIDQDKVEDKSLVGMGYLKVVVTEEGTFYDLTAAGRKIIAK